ATAAVIEDEQMTFAAKSFRNPLDVVLAEETLIDPGAVAISPGISPAIKNISTFAPTSASMPPGFLGRGAVIDDPDLAEVRAAEHDLVQVRVVRHRVDVHPIRVDRHTFLGVLGLAVRSVPFRGRRRGDRVVFAGNVVQIE